MSHPQPPTCLAGCPRFEELKRPLGVGLASTSGRHVLVDSGSLPAAVAASAAIPYVFAPVSVPGEGGGGVV